MSQSTEMITSSLAAYEPFSILSEEEITSLLDKTLLVRSAVGQILIQSGTVPEQILIVLDGEARLLGSQHGHPFTIDRMGKGTLIGMASLLRAEGCEMVTAATEMQLVSVSDVVLLGLYQRNPKFRFWCDRHLWSCELGALLGTLTQRSPRALGPAELRTLMSELTSHARLITVDAEDPWSEVGENEILLVASANIPKLPIGSILERGSQLPTPRPPLAARLVAMPLIDVERFQSAGTEQLPSSCEQQNAEAKTLIAPVENSSLDLGQFNPKQAMSLVRATGSPLAESMAVFEMITKLLELPYRRDAVEKILRDNIQRGIKLDLQLCGHIASMLGLLVTGTNVHPNSATRLITPCVLAWNEGFAIIVESNARGLTIASPVDGWVQLSPSEVQQRYPEGFDIILLERTNATPENNFGPSWFWPALKRYRGMLLQVLVASFVVQLFSLANPLLIQVIIDKVITQRSLDTLQILGIALVVVTLMEAIIGSLRTYLFTDTTNRIDIRLGAEVIDRLLRLPLGYFDKRPVGELGTRIAELEKVRNFITGQALMTVIDSVFSVIYIVVMALYSWLLTIVALMVLPIQVLLTLLGTPIIRRQIRNVATENAKTQSHLVEVLTGIQTVKAQNVEMVSRWKWQDMYGKYITRSFEKTLTGTALSETSQVLQKLSQLLVLWVGAGLVLKGEMSLGQLIAFRIISSYVTQPLLRLSSIWQNVQELRVSFERLADIVDTPEESDVSDRAKIPLPPIQGDVTFEDLFFHFSPGTPDIIKNVNLTISKGTFVGIVGQSGSGKSTLMKLLPRLYHPTNGRILVDGYDIEKVELYSLRRQIGIVPQDPLLFTGSISENIALTNPDASSDAIVKAAQVAQAHDFIMGLPSGYSTIIGERGASLSGGQRQRIAIARTLLNNPRLLVMDEATSALDYETERRVCDNLVDALGDRTVFFITHRLSTIRRADLIVMMHMGVVVETGTHDQLMSMRGRYFALYRQQEAA